MLKNLAKKDLSKSNNKKQEDIEKKIDKLAKNNSLENQAVNKKSSYSKQLNLIASLIQQQITQYYTRPPGIYAPEGLTIPINIIMRSDGKVIKVKLLSNKFTEDKKLRPHVDATLRAIEKVSVFEGLPKAGYNIWRDVIILFNPQEAR